MPRKSFWARLPFGVRMATAGLGVLALVAGTAGGVAAVTGDGPARPVTAVKQEAVVAAPLEAPAEPSAPDEGGIGQAVDADVPPIDADRSGPGEADRTATRSPRRTTAPAAPAPTATATKRVAAAAAAGPAVRIARISETQTIPFRTMLVRDPSLPRGSKRVQTAGVPGERVLHYEVTYTGTKETARRLLDSTVTREPTHRVIAFGDRRGGGDGHHDGHRPGRDCGRGGPECTPIGRSAVCSDETAPEEENLLDQHLGLLSAEDLDALDLTLPCEDATEPATVEPEKPAEPAK
ncbi:G5 domain-containing protein [Actinoplanes sp. NPDC049548]|uniref:G5 domain-containing protein n=1 Tax=Actinoplanes sp. NPDC049548 TaxID=3155152 RepID=UPI003431174A